MNTGSDGLILSDYARSVLEPLLGEAGEFWRVRVFEHGYWWFNCLKCLDALDRRSTDADWDLVDGEWGSFRWITATRRLAFRRDKLDGAPVLFRVPEYPQGALFAGEELIDVVARHRLTGFQFDLVWSVESGGVVNPPGVSLVDVFEEIDDGEQDRKREEAAAILGNRLRRTAPR